MVIAHSCNVKGPSFYTLAVLSEILKYNLKAKRKYSVIIKTQQPPPFERSFLGVYFRYL